VIGILLFGAIVVAWGLAQRLRPSPMPPALAFLLDSRLVASLVGPGLLLSRAGIDPGMRVLDAGCGPGRLTLPLAERVGEKGWVCAIDGQEGMLAKLEERLGRGGSSRGIANVAPLRVELGVDELPEVELFDRAMLCMVTGEIKKRPRAFAQLHQTLRPGGVLSVTETLEPDYRRRATVRTEIEPVGFEFEREYGGCISYTMNFAKPTLY
jgi:ubiquinone/menaquinone biosynthesis C-methylase UbiE